MVYGPFGRETLIDLTVNVIPLLVLLFFGVLFVVVNPWGTDPFSLVLSVGLILVPFGFLTLLTYVSGRAIERAEEASDGDGA